MIGTEFEGSNDVLRAPAGQEERVYGLPIFRGHNLSLMSNLVISAWKPSEEELAALNDGGNVFFVCCAQTHPPIILLGARNLEEVKMQMGGDIS